MTWFTDSPFERMMVQRPKMQQREQTVPAVLLTERDHSKRKQQQQNKEDEKCGAWYNTTCQGSSESCAGENGGE